MQNEKTKLTAAECIAALRHCTDDSADLCVDDKYQCPMWNEDRMTDYCKADLMLAAADALETAEQRIAELEAQPPKWISVEDRLPEKMKNILAANNRGKQWDIDKAWYNGAYFDRCGKRPLCHVTHWMPLPEPPKGDRNEQRIFKLC